MEKENVDQISSGAKGTGKVDSEKTSAGLKDPGEEATNKIDLKKQGSGEKVTKEKEDTKVFAKEETTKADTEKASTEQEVAAFTTSSIKLVPLNCQHIGARERQEDAFAFSDLSDSDFVENNGVLAVVADGMGGLAKGDRASQVAVSIFLREYSHKENSDSIDKFLRRTINIANYAVFDIALDDNEQEIGLGTTLVAVAVHEGRMHWVSIGDSLIYLYREDQLKQLNKEHIYANQLEADVENGLITRKEAETHPERSYLTSYLGMPELHEIDCNSEPVDLKQGDAILLCSDGLTNTLSGKEIKKVLKQSSENAAEELVNKALNKKKRHQDNITVLVLACEQVK